MPDRRWPEIDPTPDVVSRLKDFLSLYTLPDVIQPLKMVSTKWGLPGEYERARKAWHQQAMRRYRMSQRYEERQRRLAAERALGENPSLAFITSLANSGLTDTQRNLLQGQYYNLYGEYQAKVANQALTGAITPKKSAVGSFYDYLKKYPWLERYAALSPQQRGEYPSQYAPRTRFLNY